MSRARHGAGGLRARPAPADARERHCRLGARPRQSRPARARGGRMRLLTLGPASGKFATIAADPQGWVVSFQDEATGQIILQQLHAEGGKRTADVRLSIGGAAAAFPVVYVDSRKHTWWAWRDALTNQGTLLNVSTGAGRHLG